MQLRCSFSFFLLRRGFFIRGFTPSEDDGWMFVETAAGSLAGKNPPVPGQQPFPGHATAVCSHWVIKASSWLLEVFLLGVAAALGRRVSRSQ